MQAAFASRWLRYVNHSIPCRRFNYGSQGVALHSNRSYGAGNLSTKPGSWSSARTTPMVLKRLNAFLSDYPSKPAQNPPGAAPNGYALFSTASKQEQPTSLKKIGASEENVPDTKIVKTLAKYLWMKDNLEFRVRVVAALGLLIGAKVVNVQVPFLFKLAVDWLATTTSNAGALAEFI